MQLDDAGIDHLRELVGCELSVGFEQNLAGAGIDYVSVGECTFQISGINIDFADLGFLNFLEHCRGDLAAGVGDFVPALVLDAVGQFESQQVGGTLNAGVQKPAQLFLF